MLKRSVCTVFLWLLICVFGATLAHAKLLFTAEEAFGSKDFDRNSAVALVLIHGYSGSEKDWSAWCNFLAADYKGKIGVFVVQYPALGEKTIPEIKLELSQELDEEFAKRAVHVFVVAHSMGGLVAKNLDLDSKHYVDGVCFIATPHDGTDGAFARMLLGVLFQLTEEQKQHIDEILNDLLIGCADTPELRAKSFVVAGTKSYIPQPPSWMLPGQLMAEATLRLCGIDNANDGIVPRSSAQGKKNGPNITEGPRYAEFNLNHSELITSELVYQKIINDFFHLKDVCALARPAGTLPQITAGYQKKLPTIIATPTRQGTIEQILSVPVENLFATDLHLFYLRKIADEKFIFQRVDLRNGRVTDLTGVHGGLRAFWNPNGKSVVLSLHDRVQRWWDECAYYYNLKSGQKSIVPHCPISIGFSPSGQAAVSTFRGKLLFIAEDCSYSLVSQFEYKKEIGWLNDQEILIRNDYNDPSPGRLEKMNLATKRRTILINEDIVSFFRVIPGQNKVVFYLSSDESEDTLGFFDLTRMTIIRRKVGALLSQLAISRTGKVIVPIQDSPESCSLYELDLANGRLIIPPCGPIKIKGTVKFMNFYPDSKRLVVGTEKAVFCVYLY